MATMIRLLIAVVLLALLMAWMKPRHEPTHHWQVPCLDEYGEVVTPQPSAMCRRPEFSV